MTTQSFRIFFFGTALPAWVLFSFSGCCIDVGEPPDYETAQGLAVTDHTEQGIDRADVEEITRVVLEVWGKRSSLAGWRVTFESEPCRVITLKGLMEYYGYTDIEGHICVYAEPGTCLANSALGHELVHALHYENGEYIVDHTSMQPMLQEIANKTIPGMCSNEV